MYKNLGYFKDFLQIKYLQQKMSNISQQCQVLHQKKKAGPMESIQ
jgi:hypothetical protein